MGWSKKHKVQLTWVPVDFNRYWIFPEEPGCYVVYLDGILSYVGMASNLASRMRAHNFRQGYSNAWILTPWDPCRKLVVKYRTYHNRYGQWAMTELRLIKRLQPRFNKVGITRKPKDENAVVSMLSPGLHRFDGLSSNEPS